MHDNALSERGTTVALEAYARMLEEEGHRVIIGYNRTNKNNNAKVIEAIANKFELLPYKNFKKLFAKELKFDRAYWIKEGLNDGKLLPNVQNYVHSVFQYYEPHGYKYFYVSKWLADSMKSTYKDSESARCAQKTGTINANNFDFLPHSIDPLSKNANVRDALGIPDNALLVLRYGGFETFDIQFVQESIRDILLTCSDIYFCFINTKKFIKNERVIFLPAIINLQEKFNYLAAADLFLHARERGESFGLAIAEAQSVGLPVIAWRGGTDKNHLEMIPKERLYSGKEDVLQLLLNYRNMKISAVSSQVEADLSFGSHKVKKKLMKILDLN